MTDCMSGFGNHFSSELVPGILVPRQNNPQKVKSDLYAEQLSGTAFTAPRGENRRTWMYRALPSVSREMGQENVIFENFAADAEILDAGPVPMRWNPRDEPQKACDFLDGLMTLGKDGESFDSTSLSVHSYVLNKSMERRALKNHDGELLIVPYAGEIEIVTELGSFSLAPTDIALIPRGMMFRVDLLKGPAGGYICENYGKPFRLPDLGPIGANGLANPKDFMVPSARVEEADGYDIYSKYRDRMWMTRGAPTPFDVYGWHGNLVPYKFNLANFVTFGSISVDSPDPSINTVLTSPSHEPGTASIDFVAFCPRWQVMENTFRPPYFHRNVMSEFMGSVQGVYEGKATGFVPGGASLHNRMVPHGPDVDTYRNGTTADLAPHKLDNTYAFMFESRLPILPTKCAVEAVWRQSDYLRCWEGFEKRMTVK